MASRIARSLRESVIIAAEQRFQKFLGGNAVAFYAQLVILQSSRRSLKRFNSSEFVLCFLSASQDCWFLSGLALHNTPPTRRGFLRQSLRRRTQRITLHTTIYLVPIRFCQAKHRRIAVSFSLRTIFPPPRIVEGVMPTPIVNGENPRMPTLSASRST